MFSAATKTGSQPSAAYNYIENVFSTYLYTGTGTTQTITNGIDIAGKGGLVWTKTRNGTENHWLYSTPLGTGGTGLISNDASANTTYSSYNNISSFNSNGFTLGIAGSGNQSNPNGVNACSWTFAEQPKFFDVVTYTGNGSNRTISHNLGSVPGMIIVKSVSQSSDWQVYHRSLANTEYMVLNSTAAVATGTTRWNSTTPTSTVFSIGTDSTVNTNGATYVAYLFAHNAGGFGTTGTDNVITCGTFTPNPANGIVGQVDLGYEAQYLMYKRANGGSGNWNILDVMRGFNTDGTADNFLYANSYSAEANVTRLKLNATGFSGSVGTDGDYIYMAIRRPMKVPTDATTVFKPVTQTGGGTVVTNFPVDLSILRATAVTDDTYVIDRLRGTSSVNSSGVYLLTDSTAAETASIGLGYDSNTGFKDSFTSSSFNDIYWNFRRASGFFDEVCYTGTGSATSFNHNLGVVPELMIVKRRNGSTDNWCVYNQTIGNTKYMYLNDPMAADTFNLWNNTTPTSSVFSVSSGVQVNSSGGTYVAYLFATCAGVSKVGSYTGNGGTQAISCGFTGGARFVLIKRTDATGGWYVYDTARGMTTLTNPYLQLNDYPAQTATLGSVTSTAGGFTLNASILAAINTNGASYIFLAIA